MDSFIKIKHQIFKYHVPIQLLGEIFNELCDYISDQEFVFNKESYKRANMNNIIPLYLDKLLPYYHTSKQTYIEQCGSYKTLSTIIRQLCNLHNIKYKQEMKYVFSEYEIIYRIFI
jgi:hypothetical protein